MRQLFLVFLTLSWVQNANAGTCADVSYFIVDSIDTLQGSKIYTYDVRDCNNIVFRTFWSSHYGTEKVIAHSQEAVLKSTQNIAINGEWNNEGEEANPIGRWTHKTKYFWNDDQSILNVESYQYRTYERSGFEGITEILRRRTREGDLIVDRILTKTKERRRDDDEWLHGSKETKDKNEKLANFSHPVLQQ